MIVEYQSKRWVESPTVRDLIRRLGYRLLGALDEDNYIIQRRGWHANYPENLTPIQFHVLHISWGTSRAVSKYKLYRVTI